MEKAYHALDELKEINSIFEISNDSIIQLKTEMDEAKVCTPIIGRFSSGKSALVNAVLGYSRRVLKEDITPETAVPTEILYREGEDGATVTFNDGTSRELDMRGFLRFEADANTVKSVRLHLYSTTSFLREIPDVMLVDMPGFESGYEVHNKAIDNYLPQSLAYIITFPADDMIVRSSVGDILKELCQNDKPVCVVITKYDKRNEDDFEITFAKLKDSLKRYLGDREIRYCITSSRDGDVEQLERVLKEIQEQSKDILGKKYRAIALHKVKQTENYLQKTLQNGKLSESVLAEKEERMKGQLASLASKYDREKQGFDSEMRDCVEEIKNDVRIALESEESSFVSMVLNGQSINERVNLVVRSALTASVKKRYIPRAEKYIKHLSKYMENEMAGDVSVSLYYDTEQLNKSTSSIVAMVAGTVVGGPIFGLLATLITSFFTKRNKEKKREEAKQEIRRRLRGEVYPQIMDEIGHSIEKTIFEQANLLNASIEEDIQNQRALLEKAMNDAHAKKEEETKNKTEREDKIKESLETIARIKDELR